MQGLNGRRKLSCERASWEECALSCNKINPLGLPNWSLDTVGWRRDLQFSNLILARKFLKIPPFFVSKKLVD